MKITKELLRRYNLGEITEQERKAVEDWFQQLDDPSVGPKAPIDPEENKRQIWSQLSNAVPELESRPLGERAVVPLPKRLMRYAAVAIILVTAGFFSYRLLSDSLGTNRAEQSITLKTINTERGEKRTVTLSDGSTIRMNYETEIRVPEKFEGNERIVYLTGHAHFDVARNEEKPFIIYTEDTKTQVLGTSFDINTKSPDETEVIVTSGKVAFSEKEKVDNAVTLTVNDRAVLNSDKSIATSQVNAQKLTAWKENRLVFDGETLREIIEVLAPWYDIQILVEDPELLDEDFKLSRDNPSLQLLLKEMSFAAGFNYKIEGKEVIIFK